ncbi:DUF493 family protein [Roseivirga sp. BDSF3-8]|uniref:DUF493 family protein n=1 Tax=Roseivirga sp. BDSF3-8 TaxID=3241598 RepID=UPI0035319A65
MSARKFDFDSFQQKLDDQFSWPTLYMFKFIVPAGKEGEVEALFPKNESTNKPSKNGNYISVTTKAMMPSSDEVIRIYKEATGIEGLIAL